MARAVTRARSRASGAVTSMLRNGIPNVLASRRNKLRCQRFRIEPIVDEVDEDAGHEQQTAYPELQREPHSQFPVEYMCCAAEMS